MKLSLVPILAFIAALPVLALPEPVAAPVAELPAPTVFSGPPVKASEANRKRDNAGVVQKAKLGYHKCPRNSCQTMGSYTKGTHITIKCYTRDHTSVVNGDAGWAKLSSNGYWIALANGDYVSWTGAIPYCT